MQNKILLIVVLILAGFYNIQRGFNNKKTSFSSEKIIMLDTKTDTTKTLEMENYLIGVIAAEMPASFEKEALKAQAIAARSFAYYKINTRNGEYDLTNDITTQAYIEKESMKEKWQDKYEYYYEKIKTAVNETKDLVLVYDNKIISAYYFSMSNGKTENASLVFNEDKNYLVSVESSEPVTSNNFEVTKVISTDEFCQKLNITQPVKIDKINKSQSGRINSIRINNIEFVGTTIRKLLNLRSTDFEISIDGASIYIKTKGYGHGVGMSQYGANEMAKNGSAYDDILYHYYTGVKIANINSIN